MIASLILPLALLPQRGESDLSDILKIVVLLLLPALLGIGKAVLDKVKGKNAAKAPRQRPTRQVPSTGASPGGPEPVERLDPEEFWEELVAQATGEAPPAAAELAELPLAATRLDVDMTADPAPSHLEDYLESHPHVDLVELRELGDSRQRDAIDLAPVSRATPGFALRQSMDRGGGWRRAIVLAEVLGAPRALRRGEGQPGMR